MAPNHISAAVSFIGLALSLYALYVEHNLHIDTNYQPMCDIASYVSCSKAFRSPFAEGLGVAPPILGADHILTQVCQIDMTVWESKNCQYWKITVRYKIYPTAFYSDQVKVGTSSINFKRFNA